MPLASSIGIFIENFVGIRVRENTQKLGEEEAQAHNTE